MHRRFFFRRPDDGLKVEGIQFSDGVVVLHWATKTPATTVFDSMDNAMAVHARDGRAELIWLDHPPTPVSPPANEGHSR